MLVNETVNNSSRYSQKPIRTPLTALHTIGILAGGMPTWKPAGSSSPGVFWLSTRSRAAKLQEWDPDRGEERSEKETVRKSKKKKMSKLDSPLLIIQVKKELVTLGLCFEQCTPTDRNVGWRVVRIGHQTHPVAVI